MYRRSAIVPKVDPTKEFSHSQGWRELGGTQMGPVVEEKRWRFGAGGGT